MGIFVAYSFCNACQNSEKRLSTQSCGESKKAAVYFYLTLCALIQFEKATEVSQIDIGNEASAFVEVLVGKSSAKEEDYQVTRCPVLSHVALFAGVFELHVY